MYVYAIDLEVNYSYSQCAATAVNSLALEDEVT